MKPSIAQKILYFLLIALILLMVFYSIQARSNLGQQGFDQCIQWKCENRYGGFCEKFREINNCCLGADGRTVFVEGKATCIFV